MITLIYEVENFSDLFESQMRESSGLDSVQCIAIDGTDLAKSYNSALKKAKYDTVVFLRKDVRICSQNWGRRIQEIFSTTSYGIIGTLGSLIVPMSGMLWEKEEPLCGTIWYEHYNDSCKNSFGEDFGKKIHDVVALEGSFFAIHKERIAKRFDESFKGDSFFETDFCIENYKKGVKLGVFYGVDILKDYFDEQDEPFLKNHKKFLKKHTDLPHRIVPELIVDIKELKIDTTPSVQVIIPTKGKPKELINCLQSIESKTQYENYTISVIDYGSAQKEIEEILEFVGSKENIELIKGEIPQEAYLCNEEAEKSDAELLLFLSKNLNFENDCISLMVDAYLKNSNDCGTLGIRTHQKNHMVRQFGLQLTSFEGEEGMELGLNMRGFGKSYAFKNETVSGVMGNSIECMMIDKALFKELGAFNTSYMHSLQDFELNLKAILAGKKNILVGNAVATYMSFDKPKFLPKDYLLLMDYINSNIETVFPYVNLISA